MLSPSQNACNSDSEQRTRESEVVQRDHHVVRARDSATRLVVTRKNTMNPMRRRAAADSLLTWSLELHSSTSVTKSTRSTMAV